MGEGCALVSMYLGMGITLTLTVLRFFFRFTDLNWVGMVCDGFSDRVDWVVSYCWRGLASDELARDR